MNSTIDTQFMCNSYLELISGIVNVLLLLTTVFSECTGLSKCKSNSLVELPLELLERTRSRTRNSNKELEMADV